MYIYILVVCMFIYKSLQNTQGYWLTKKTFFFFFSPLILFTDTKGVIFIFPNIYQIYDIHIYIMQRLLFLADCFSVSFFFFLIWYGLFRCMLRFVTRRNHLFCYCNEGHSTEIYYIWIINVESKKNVIVAWIHSFHFILQSLLLIFKIR